MRLTTKIFAGLLCICVAAPAAAQTPGPGWFYIPKATGFAGVSTLGIGAGIGFHGPDTLLGTRLSFNLFRFGLNFKQRQAESRAEATLQNESIILDFYPTRGHFRLSAGIVFNQNSAKYSSSPDLTGPLLGYIHRTHYTGPIGDVHGRITFNPVAPYLGIGYTTDTGTGWFFNADAGAMYQGTGRISFTPSGLVAAMPQTRAAITANAYKADNEISKISVYPVISLQAGFHF